VGGQEAAAIPTDWRGTENPSLSTGLPPLDALLPGGGFRRGTCVEWLAEGPGVGLERLALAAAPHALRPGGACLVIDPRREFFPRGALPLGIDLDRLIVLRPRSLEDALWGAEQALRCPAVDVVIGWNELLPRGRNPDRAYRRLQLAAEEGSVLGVLLRPASVQRWKCWGDVRVLVEAHCRASPSRGPVPSRRAWTLHLLHCRGALSGRTLSLEFDDETGAVRVVSELADPAADRGAAGA
jgi:hypothetical protein